MEKILLLQCAALGYDFLLKNQADGKVGSICFKPADSVFPALTCPVQATMRTAVNPDKHGMVANGFFSRKLAKPFFWEQSSNLVEGSRIWDEFRASGGTVAQLFWQQSLGADSDYLLSPAPIHKHSGGMIEGCYDRPAGLYDELCSRIGRDFKLRWYWGPLASGSSSVWISEAIDHVMKETNPDLILAYLPHLDYELQRSGPDSQAAAKVFNEWTVILKKILNNAQEAGYRTIVFGDYAIVNVSRCILPNKILRQAGLMHTRRIKGMDYPDLYTSRAFATVDHQIAHVIVPDRNDLERSRKVLSGVPGIKRIISGREKAETGIDHPHCGDLVLEAEDDTWFGYYWWDKAKEAPDYAGHVDIHNKPGFDPCELFFGRTPFSVSTRSSRIKGSHGSISGKERKVAWGTDIDLDKDHGSLLELAQEIKKLL